MNHPLKTWLSQKCYPVIKSGCQAIMIPSNFELRFYLHFQVKGTLLTIACVAGRILHVTAFVLAAPIPWS